MFKKIVYLCLAVFFIEASVAIAGDGSALIKTSDRTNSEKVTKKKN